MAHDYLNIYTILLFTNTAFSFTLGFYVAGFRSTNVSRGVIGVLAGAGLWSLADGMKIAAPRAGEILFWNQVTYVGAAIIPPATVLFIAAYTDQEEWLRVRRFAILVAISLVILPFVFLNPEGLWRAGEQINPASNPPVMSEEFGLVHVLWNAYVILFIVPLLFGLLIKALRETASSMFRRQIYVIMIALAGPVLTSILYVSGVSPIDLTPLGFAGFAVVITVAVRQYGVLEILPIARDTVVSTTDTGVFVVDRDNRLVDLNPRAARLVDSQKDAVVGRQISDLAVGNQNVIETLQATDEFPTTVAIEENGSTNHYNVDVSTIRDNTGRGIGLVVTVNDVTETIERQEALAEKTRELTKKNERLDQFASMVSHDLRNPLNVAQLELQRGRETNEDEALGQASEALDRMDRMIDQMLTLARMDTLDSSREAVQLQEATNQAWKSVAPTDSELRITHAIGEIDAHRTFLVELLENLFRNAIEHNDEAVTVTVGPLPDSAGFFIADDGSGISSAVRDEVFDQGFTTASGNTGFGLAIVEDIVDVHDWSITIVDSEEGGARFEIRTESQA